MYNPIQEQFNGYLNKYGSTLSLKRGIVESNIEGFFKEKTEDADMLITLYTEDSISKGDYIIDDLETYLVKGVEMEKSNVYNRCALLKCNTVAKLYINSVLYIFPCFTQANSFGFDYGKITFADGKAFIKLQKNDASKKIAINQRIIQFQQGWKIVGFSYDEDVLELICDKVATSTDDDLENEIANRWSYGDTYTIDITNTYQQLIVGETLAINKVVTKNGVVDTTQFITYTSSNTNFATVDTNGLITCVVKGQVTITAKLTDHETVSDTLVISVIEAEEPLVVYTIDVTNAETELDINDAFAIATTVTVDGVTVTNEPITYTSSNNSIATVNSSGLVTCIADGNVTISAKLANDITKFDTLTLTVLAAYLPTYTLSVATNPSNTSNRIVGDIIYLLPTVTKDGLTVTDEPITYSTTNSSSATISSTGVITCVGTGSVILKAELVNDTTKNYLLSLTVNALPSYTYSIDLTNVNQTQNAGYQLQLITTVTRHEEWENDVVVTNEPITYLSSDSAIASVDEYGLLTFVGGGTATITAKLTNHPTVLDTMIATSIASAPSSYFIDITNNALSITNTATLNIIYKEDNVQKTVTTSNVWFLSDASGVASISNTGVITVHSNGRVGFYAFVTADDSIYDTYTVNVVKS